MSSVSGGTRTRQVFASMYICSCGPPSVDANGEGRVLRGSAEKEKGEEKRTNEFSSAVLSGEVVDNGTVETVTKDDEKSGHEMPGVRVAEEVDAVERKAKVSRKKKGTLQKEGQTLHRHSTAHTPPPDCTPSAAHTFQRESRRRTPAAVPPTQ
jgi:hypothetical protein